MGVQGVWSTGEFSKGETLAARNYNESMTRTMTAHILGNAIERTENDGPAITNFQRDLRDIFSFQRHTVRTAVETHTRDPYVLNARSVRNLIAHHLTGVRHQGTGHERVVKTRKFILKKIKNANTIKKIYKRYKYDTNTQLEIKFFPFECLRFLIFLCIGVFRIFFEGRCMHHNSRSS